ncbi:MAG TPA: hypothetical protein VGC42_17040 [Kofleriaceae bacterium]
MRAALLCLLLASPAVAEPRRGEPPALDVRLPPGTRTDAHGQLVSGRGLRETTDWLARDLDRRGIAVQRVGPYDVRGIELTRFVSQTPSTPWLAIHAMRSAGKTLIYFVPRAKIAATP